MWGDRLEGFRESRRCSRDTYPESYITEYILIYEDKVGHVTLIFDRQPNSRTPPCAGRSIRGNFPTHFCLAGRLSSIHVGAVLSDRSEQV